MQFAGAFQTEVAVQNIFLCCRFSLKTKRTRPCTQSANTTLSCKCCSIRSKNRSSSPFFLFFEYFVFIGFYFPLAVTQIITLQLLLMMMWSLMSSDVGLTSLLGTNCDQCMCMVQYCLMSTETGRLIRMGSPGQPPHTAPELYDIILQLCVWYLCVPHHLPWDFLLLKGVREIFKMCCHLCVLMKAMWALETEHKSWLRRNEKVE